MPTLCINTQYSTHLMLPIASRDLRPEALGAARSSINYEISFRRKFEQRTIRGLGGWNRRRRA